MCYGPRSTYAINPDYLFRNDAPRRTMIAFDPHADVRCTALQLANALRTESISGSAEQSDPFEQSFAYPCNTRSA